MSCCVCYEHGNPIQLNCHDLLSTGTSTGRRSVRSYCAPTAGRKEQCSPHLPSKQAWQCSTAARAKSVCSLLHDQQWINNNGSIIVLVRLVVWTEMRQFYLSERRDFELARRASSRHTWHHSHTQGRTHTANHSTAGPPTTTTTDTTTRVASQVDAYATLLYKQPRLPRSLVILRILAVAPSENSKLV